MKTILLLALVIGLANPTWGQILGQKKTPEERRTEIHEERSAILKKISEAKPEITAKLENAPGYATFSAVNVNLLLLATARGSGVVMDNQSNTETFMSIISVGGGVGAGIKDLRALLVFNDHDTLREFVSSGWSFGAQADASLKSGDKGAAIGEGISVSADTEEGGIDTALGATTSESLQTETSIEVYRITESGISLQATIAGTKFSKIDELNE